MSPLAAIAFALFLVAVNALFVGTEFALISARRSQIEPRAEAGSTLAKITLTAMENITLVIGVNQLGITIASLVLGAVGEPAVAHLTEPVLEALHVPQGFLHPVSFTIALLVVVYLHVVMGEMIPKNLALANPERAVLLLGPLVWMLVLVLRPVIVVINAVAALVLRAFGVELKEEVSSSFTREEVAALVEESMGEGLIQQDEYDRLAGALGFVERDVSAVLLLVDEVTTVAQGATPADVEAVCAATGFSRFPVAQADGELLGYLHIKDVLETDEARRLRPIEDKWIRSFASIGPEEPLHAALESLQRRGAHMGRVVDSDGRTIGVITLEDVLEELVGEIRDAAHQDEPRSSDASR